jgi:hypothetical protein
MSALDQFEGMVPPMVMKGEREPCSLCGEPLTRNDTITFYWCDVDYVNGRDGASIYRMYCSDCNRQEVQFPALGVVELLAEADYTEEGVIENVRKQDVSGSDDGVPWDPPNMFRLFFGETIATMLSNIPDANGGPEDVYDTLMKGGIDASEVVNDKGQVVKTEDELKSMRELLMDTAESLG